MQKFSWILLFLASVLSFSVYSEPAQSDLYSYLMLHPAALKNEMAECQKAVDPAKPLTPHCVIVMKAADKMLALIEQQQKNPEKFGQDILRAQMELAASDTQANKDKVRMLLQIVGLSSPE